MTGELLLVDDVADAFTAIVTASCGEPPSPVNARETTPFRLGCSGGTTGKQCFGRLAESSLAWERIALYFADERCVPAGSPDANATLLSTVLGARAGALAGFYPMSCAEGAAAYEATIRASSGFDLLHLGVGPDGHTASLFPNSPGLDAAKGRLVVRNEDPSGLNSFERMTLTFEAIALAELVVVTVTGEEKREVLQRLARGEDLPAARIEAKRTVWLVDADAAGDLPARPTTIEEVRLLGRRTS